MIAEGRINRPEIGERALAEGACDLVGMTRALIADPLVPRRARDGRDASGSASASATTSASRAATASSRSRACRTPLRVRSGTLGDLPRRPSRATSLVVGARASRGSRPRAWPRSGVIA